MAAELAGEDDVVERGEAPVGLEKRALRDGAAAVRQAGEGVRKAVFADAGEVAEVAQVGFLADLPERAA